MRLAASLFTLFTVAVLGGGTVLAGHRATQREVLAEAAFPPEGQLIEVAGRQVHAVVMGEGPDLVLIHGANGSTRDFTFGFADRLAADYRVLIFDRPGLGFTDRTTADHARAFARGAESPAEQAALLRAAAAALGAERPIVLGHSYGNAVALAWALDHPDNIAALVNVAGASMPWPGSLGALYSVGGTALGGGLLAPLVTAFAPQGVVEGIVDTIFEPNPTPNGYVDHIGAELSIRRDSFRANARQVNGLRPHIVAMSARYGTLSLPVEIVHGAADTIVPPAIHSERLVGLIEGANLTLLPGIGHMPHHSAPDDVIAAIHRAAERAGLR